MNNRWQNFALILYVVALLWWFRRELPPFAPSVSGRIESVGTMSWPVEGIYCLLWDGSEGHVVEETGRKYRNGEYQVGIGSRTPVWDYSGGLGEVRVGQTVSIWFTGKAVTSPPWYYPHSVVIEPSTGMNCVVVGTLTIALILGLGGFKWVRRPQQYLGAERSAPALRSEDSASRLNDQGA